MLFQLDYTRLPESTSAIETKAGVPLIGIVLMAVVVILVFMAIYCMFYVESKHHRKNKLNKADRELEKELKKKNT